MLHICGQRRLWYPDLQSCIGTDTRNTSPVQLSYGLSTEYTKKPTSNEDFNAERQLYSKYYISQILQLGEEGIHDAWNKVCGLVLGCTELKQSNDCNVGIL